MMQRDWLALACLRMAAARGLVSNAVLFCAGFPVRLRIPRSANRRYATGPANRACRLLSSRVLLRAGDEKGQALVEEALILALIAVLGVGALTVLQEHVADAIGSVSASLGAFDPTARRGGK